MFKNILVPVDGSDDSWVALEQAIQLADSKESVIHGLFVADSRLLDAPYLVSMYTYDYVLSTDPAAVEAAMKAGEHLKERGEKILETFRQRCQRAGVQAQTTQVEGSVSQIILNRAQKADLLVMGRHGEGARWAGLMLGSTFETVVRHSPIPVLAAQSETRRTTRILLAFDGSQRSKDALNLAVDMASKQALPIVLLTVDDGHKDGKKAHQAAEDLLRKKNITVNPIFWKGHPAEEILRAARVENCNLIVMGAYGHSKFLEIFYGNTAEEVVRGATCPVLVYR